MTEKRLGDIAAFINGYPFKLEDRGDDGLQIIRIQNLTDPTKPYNKTLKDLPEKYRISEGDILISWSATLGIYVWKGEDALLNQHIFKVVIEDEGVDPSYFRYAVERSLKQLESNVRGSTMKHVLKRDFEALSIPVPDLRSQRQIVAALDKAMALIDMRQKSIEMLDQLRSDTFLSMFGNLASNIHGFNILTLKEVTSHIKDGPHVSPKYSDTGYPILSTRNIRPFELVESNFKYVDEETYSELVSRFQPTKGDVLMTKGGTTGYAKEVDFDFDFCVWVHLAVLRPKKELVNPTYLESVLNSKNVYLQSQYYTRGIANKDLGLKRIAKLEILLPPLELQEKYARFAKSLFAQKGHLIKNKALQESLFQSLLQRAFHGDLNIHPDLQLDGFLEKENFEAIATDAVLIQTLIDRFNLAKFNALSEEKEEEETRPLAFESEAAYNRSKDGLLHLLKEGLVTQEMSDDKDEFITRLTTS